MVVTATAAAGGTASAAAASGLSCKKSEGASRCEKMKKEKHEIEGMDPAISITAI